MPDDPQIEDMDPVMKLWMFHNWAEDHNDNFELLKNHGYLVGSFINPEAVKKILGVGATTYTTTDEEFEESAKKILEENKELDNKPIRRRKRKIVKE